MREQLTKSDVEKIKEEIEYRKLVVRKEALEAVKEARAHGDLSENFEYHAAKKDKNRNESRIRYLERMLKSAQIVTSIRGNSLKGMISIESPIGKALLGHKVGDRVHIQVSDAYGYEVVIRSITKTTDEENDKIRGF